MEILIVVDAREIFRTSQIKWNDFVGRKRDDKLASNGSRTGNEDEILSEAEEFYADSGDYGEFRVAFFFVLLRRHLNVSWTVFFSSVYFECLILVKIYLFMGSLVEYEFLFRVKM